MHWKNDQVYLYEELFVTFHSQFCRVEGFRTKECQFPTYLQVRLLPSVAMYWSRMSPVSVAVKTYTINMTHDIGYKFMWQGYEIGKKLMGQGLEISYKLMWQGHKVGIS